jgi:hypothetical protein
MDPDESYGAVDRLGESRVWWRLSAALPALLVAEDLWASSQVSLPVKSPRDQWWREKKNI